MQMRGAIATALLVLCLAPHAPTVTGQDASATVTSVFDLYGNGVEPFGSSQTTAIQKALAQSAGHGVTQDDVSISVLSTYTDQQNSGRRRLAQSNKLVQPGVQLQAQTKTTQQSAPDVASSIDNALSSNQIAQVYNQQGGQGADYTTVVTASSTGSGSGSDSGGQVVNGSTSSGGGGGGKGSSFPTWAIAIIVILVLVLVALVTGYIVWRKRAARRVIKAQEFEAASYFSNTKPSGGAPGGGTTFRERLAGLRGSIFGAGAAPAVDPPGTLTSPSAEGAGGLLRNPTTPFSQTGFNTSGGAGTGTSPRVSSLSSPVPPLSGSPSGKYAGFARTTSGGTTPRGSSLPTANPLYTTPPLGGSPYVPTRAGRLMNNLRS